GLACRGGLLDRHERLDVDHGVVLVRVDQTAAEVGARADPAPARGFPGHRALLEVAHDSELVAGVVGGREVDALARDLLVARRGARGGSPPHADPDGDRESEPEPTQSVAVHDSSSGTGIYPGGGAQVEPKPPRPVRPGAGNGRKASTRAAPNEVRPSRE